MARLARYEPDHHGFGRYMRSDDVADAAHSVARDIANLARTTAEKGKTGNYSRGFRVDRSYQTMLINDGEGSGLRRISSVYNDDGAAAPLEFGNKRTKARRTLGRAAAAIGEPFGSLRVLASSWGADR
jgi:hypothetical protein